MGLALSSMIVFQFSLFTLYQYSKQYDSAYKIVASSARDAEDIIIDYNYKAIYNSFGTHESYLDRRTIRSAATLLPPFFVPVDDVVLLP